MSVLDDPIYKRRRELEQKVRSETMALLKAYNEEHYYPELNKIQVICEAVGHGPAHTRLMMFGTSYICDKCGKQVRFESHDYPYPDP